MASQTQHVVLIHHGSKAIENMNIHSNYNQSGHETALGTITKSNSGLTRYTGDFNRRWPNTLEEGPSNSTSPMTMAIGIISVMAWDDPT